LYSPLHRTCFVIWAARGEVGYGIATLFEDGYMTVIIVGSGVYSNPQKAIVVAAADGWYGYVWTLKLK
jgi:hypothetical protein